MAVVSPQSLCKRTEITLDQMTTLYDNVEKGNTNNNLNQVLEATSSEVLTQITSLIKTKPNEGGVGCAEAKATIVFDVPDCSDYTCEKVSFGCNTNTPAKREKKAFDYIIDKQVCDSFTVDARLFDCGCEDRIQDLEKQLQTSKWKMQKSENTQLAESIIAGVGSDHAGNPTLTVPKPLKIFRPGLSGELVPQPLGFFDIGEEYAKQNPSGGVSPVIVTSSRMFNQYRYSSQFFAGNVDGLDGSRDSLDNIFYDPSLASIPGVPSGDIALSWLPGSLHKVNYFDFSDESKRIGGSSFFEPSVSTNRVVRTIMDLGGRTGGAPYLVDAEIFYDDCNNTVTYTFQRLFGLVCPPQEVFCPGTTYNFKMLWEIQCAIYGCPDIATP